MSTTSDEKVILKKEKSNLEKEISSLKKLMRDYKAERKTNWKEFKKKMNDEVGNIEKSVGGFASRKKK